MQTPQAAEVAVKKFFSIGDMDNFLAYVENYAELTCGFEEHAHNADCIGPDCGSVEHEHIYAGYDEDDDPIGDCLDEDCPGYEHSHIAGLVSEGGCDGYICGLHAHDADCKGLVFTFSLSDEDGLITSEELKLPVSDVIAGNVKDFVLTIPTGRLPSSGLKEVTITETPGSYVAV
jgi:hypothetical protein